MAKSGDCWLNGKFVALGDARVSVMDRGFLFGDGVYEVVPAYGRRLFCWREHMQRLQRSLRETRINFNAESLRAPAEELIAAQSFDDQALYIHISRGAEEQRRHAFGDDITPTVFMASWQLPRPSADAREKGVACITAEDFRWLRGDIKCTSLLAAVLLSKRAQDANAAEVVLFRDGLLTEGAAANIVIVSGGEARTPSAGEKLLRGITVYDAVRAAAQSAGLPLHECEITRPEVASAQEIWLCSSTKEILPVTMLDGAPVGEGKPGEHYKRARKALDEFIARAAE